MRLILHLRFLPLLCIFIFVTAAQAAYFGDGPATGPGAELRGRVLGADDGAPLIGVNVYIPALSLGATTDLNGEFAIKGLPVGTLSLTVSHIGYRGTRREVSMEAARPTTVELRLDAGIHEMGTVVVTGSSTPYLYTESPVKTEVITRKLIAQSQAVNLADALSLQTGVSVDNSCQNCNFTQVRILGFDGKYAQVLVDGDPVVSSLAAVYALEHFPDEMIEQIEVVKGGGSALYGGGALAGTINMRTRTPMTTRTRFNYLGHSIKGTLDHKAGAVTEWVSDDASMGAYLYLSARKRDGYDHNGDGFTELGSVRNSTLGVNWYYRPAKLGEFQVSLHQLGEERRGGSDMNLPQHEARVAEWTEHDRWGGKLRWEHRVLPSLQLQAHYGFSLLDRDSYYGGLAGDSPEERLDALRYYGFSQNRTHIVGVRSVIAAGAQDITAGIEYSTDHLVDRSVRDAEFHIDAVYTNLGAYVQDAVTMFDGTLVLIAGARVDHHSELDDLVFSPRVNARIGLLRDLGLRLAFTTGFKAPQVFDEDLHIESLGGAQRVIRNAADLRAERSRSWSANLDYNTLIGRMPVMIGLTAFHTDLLDAFSMTELALPESGLILWQRVNSDGGSVRGVEIDFGLRPAAMTEIRLGATYKTGRYDNAQEVFDGVYSDRFLYTPDISGYLRVSQTVDERISLFGALRYTGSLTLPNATTEEIVETTESFADIDLGATYAIPLGATRLQLNLGVKNLLDAYQTDLQSGIDRDPSYLYGPSQPRRLYLGIEVQF